MSVFPSWPWTNFHEMNLDWVIKKVKYIEEHLEEIVVDATTDMLDDRLTNPDKAAQAKVTGDAIRGNAADIASLDTTVQGITNNVTNLTTRVTRNEGNINKLLAFNEALDTTIQGIKNNVSDLTTRVTRNEGTINDLLAADRSLDDRLTNLNNRYEGTYQDVITLQSAVRHTETQITGLGDADEALSDRITTLEDTVNAVKDYVFNIYEYDGANDPMWICTMKDSPNTINSLLSDLNGRIPVNVKAVISDNGMTSSRVGNLTTVRVGNEIHGVEFDAGDFHCRFLDSNTMGTAYFRHVVITHTTSDTGVYTKGDYQSIAHYPANIVIVISEKSYKVVNIGPGQQSDELVLSYLEIANQALVLRNVMIDPQGRIQFA